MIRSNHEYSYESVGELRAELKYREQIIQAVRLLEHRNVPYVTNIGDPVDSDRQYWTHNNLAHRWPQSIALTAEGQSHPDLAIAALFDPTKTRLECATAVMACVWYAQLQTKGKVGLIREFGSQVRDRMEGSDFLITNLPGPHYISPSYKALLKRSSVKDPSDLIPGDIVVFRNFQDYAKRHPAGYWANLNAVYLGKDSQGVARFSGLGVYGKSKRDILKSLHSEYGDTEKLIEQLPDFRSGPMVLLQPRP